MNTGIVIKSTGSWVTVKDREETFSCKVKGNLKMKNIKTTNPVTVGDIVTFSVLKDGSGLISIIQPRKNYIIRKSSKLSKEAHLLAANVDQALLMITIKDPSTPREFIDRFLITAEAYHISTHIVINKMDLVSEDLQEELDDFLSVYDKAGYNCISTSIHRPSSLKPVVALLKNKITVIAGNSGVGKSSIINIIEPNLQLKVKEISSSHNTGKHTTTFSEMFPLSKGGYIIDTPGIRGFGIIDFEKNELGLFFPEIFSASKDCKYYNCTHVHEPGCAVMEAVNNNDIGLSRYKSYLNILHDEHSKYRK